MIFWRVKKLLHILSICFLLFEFLLWKRGRMAKALSCGLAAGDRSPCSNPVQYCRSLWTWMSQKSYCKCQLKLRLKHSRFIYLVFFFLIKHLFNQITQVWAHYFKLLNRVQSTQDEKARFIKGNEFKLSYFHSFFLREHTAFCHKLNIDSYSMFYGKCSYWYCITSNH